MTAMFKKMLKPEHPGAQGRHLRQREFRPRRSGRWGHDRAGCAQPTHVCERDRNLHGLGERRQYRDGAGLRHPRHAKNRWHRLDSRRPLEALTRTSRFLYLDWGVPGKQSSRKGVSRAKVRDRARSPWSR
jgi:hypothetical protein